jgi:hypothetical protein
MSRSQQDLKYDAIRKQNLMLKIKNQKQDDIRQAPFWNAKQHVLYPNTLNLNHQPTQQEVLIIETNHDNSIFEEQNRGVAKGLITSISNPQIADYVINKLDANEVAGLNQQFENLKRVLKKEYLFGISKDALVNYIKTVISRNKY